MFGPMDGLMAPIFCQTVNELNLVDYWMTPFIRLSTAVPKPVILQKRLIPFLDTPNSLVIVQLLGNNPAMLADAAKEYQKLGVAGVNLNFGCPSKRVLQRNGGGKLLSQPDLMLEIVNSIIKACPDLSVSVKLRAGYKSPDEMESFLPQLAKLDIDFIVLHSRTVLEMYNTHPGGRSRISRAVALTAPIPLIASGDIFSMRDAMDMYEATACAGITFARGFLQDPFCVRRLQTALKNEKFNRDTDSKKLFYNKMSELADGDEYNFKRSYFLEIARLMWGIDSPEFIAESKR